MEMPGRKSIGGEKSPNEGVRMAGKGRLCINEGCVLTRKGQVGPTPFQWRC